jgi:DNA-binding winged helix-turn-helix (wHTH) protein/TolB-like protein/Flp pilus assembly protein TadD
MSSKIRHFYEFGPFRLDAKARVLLRENKPVPLTPKAVETLLALIEQGGEVIGREELIRRVWPDTFVEENNLNVNVSALRKALGAAPDGRPYIETLSRRGYRFVAEVRRSEGNGAGEAQGQLDGLGEAVQHLEGDSTELVVERRTRERIVVVEEEQREDPRVVAVGAEALPITDGGRAPRSRRAMLVVTAAALALVTAGTILYFRQWGGRRHLPAPAAVRSLAVLPLRPIGPADPAGNYLGLGLADALTTDLGRLGEISVRPTSATLRFDKPDGDAITAARSLGVDAVLEGSYQREGDRLRITLQLVSARDGAQLWAGSFEDEFTNIFAVQDSLSRQVTGALSANMEEMERRSQARRPTENAEAYQHYLKGRYLWTKKSTEGLQKALAHFEQAVRIDPQYARAHSGLADCYLGLSEHGVLPREEAVRSARAAALSAAALDPFLAEVRTSLGFIYLTRDWDYAAAEREFKRAIELDPSDATARQFYGVYLLAVGRRDEAVQETRRALELDPPSHLNNTQLGRALYLAGRFDEVIEQCQKALELDPGSASARAYLGQAYAHKGMLREALIELERAVELSGGRPEMKAALAYAYALAGKGTETRRIIEELSSSGADASITSYHVATAYAAFPDPDKAFAKLREAYEARDIFLGVRLKTDPKLERLRPDPRFAELLRRLGLTP